MFLLLAEVHAEVEAVIHGHPEVVALDIADGGRAYDTATVLRIIGDRNAWIGLCGQGAAIAATENPGTAQIEAVAELVLHGDAEVVATVVFGGERIAVVDFHAFAVEFPHGTRPGIANPARSLAEGALNEQFHTVGPASAEVHFVLPSLAGAKETGAVLVFQHIVHRLVIAFKRDVEQVGQFIETAERELVSTFGCNPCRDRHPEVGGHGDVAVGKQVDVLRHVGITRFE